MPGAALAAQSNTPKPNAPIAKQVAGTHKKVTLELGGKAANIVFDDAPIDQAIEGMRLVKEWLPKAVKDGKDLAARAHMLAAASMGATAFQKGLGAIHSLSHPVGALYDTHHGLTNAVFMPYVLAFNRPAIEDRMVRLAAWLGLKNPSFNAVQDWVLALREELKIPAKLDGLGVDGARIDEIAAMAAEDPTAPTNPVPAGVPEMRKMFAAALEGRL